MRSIWNGTITFGLIAIPVKLFTAVGRQDAIDLHLLHDEDGERVRYKRVCEAGHEVDWDDVVKGYEYEKGRWVTLADEELEALDTESLKTIDVHTFVPAEQIDPIYYDRTYYVVPDEAGLKAYELFVEALEEEQLVGVAKVAIREREHLSALRLRDGVIVLETMHWPDEIRASEFAEFDKRSSVRVSDQERKMARTLIQSLAGEFRPDDFEDEYVEALRKLIEDKIEGREIVVPEAREEPERVVDLMDALRRSVEAARKGEKPKAKPRDAGTKARAGGPRRELEAWTKDELLDRARELGIKGRSSMDKAELIEAIERRSA